MVAPATEHANQPAHHLLVIVTVEPFTAQFVAHQLFGALTFGARVDVGKCGGDHLVVDALGVELGGQGALAFSGMHPTRPHPLLGEVGVIDQADTCQPVEHLGGDIVGIAALGQLTGQFGTGARPRGEQAQAERPRLLFAREFSRLRSQRGLAGLRHRSPRRQYRAFP